MAGAAGGVRRTHNGRPGIHAARPNSQLLRRVQPVITRVCSGRRLGSTARGQHEQSDQNRATVPALPGPQTAAQENPM